jgi:hypothetical protein
MARPVGIETVEGSGNPFPWRRVVSVPSQIIKIGALGSEHHLLAAQPAPPREGKLTLISFLRCLEEV